MNATYNLGEFGTMETTINKRNNLIYGFVGRENESYLFRGKDISEFEENMIEVLQEHEDFWLAAQIKENGLEKTSQSYQNLQSKTEVQK